MGAVGFVLLAIASTAIYAALAASQGDSQDFAQAEAHQPPADVSPERVAELITSDPAVLKPLSVEDAVAANSAIAVATVANPSSSPLIVSGGSGDFAQALQCMTTAIYYEAGNESIDGGRAVAQVILNRVRHTAYPNSVCGVVYQGSERQTGCQFSFTCDGSLLRKPRQSSWLRAQALAAEALSGRVYAPVGLSTHYHANYVLPYWAPTLLKTAVVGAHIFYRWTGTAGTQVAFRSAYAGENSATGALPIEPTVASLALEAGASPVSTERRVLDQSIAKEEHDRPGLAETPVVAERWVLGTTPPPVAGREIAMKTAPVALN
ncbi:cell wall hydrolase [Novosphingobium sp. RD2P27]|uniref:Cell wall hydrolase n=1 Tax=Novosphingobium kalidii TaxID=3230299 RepID=A0ABV2D0G0_9SPHN